MSTAGKPRGVLDVTDQMKEAKEERNGIKRMPASLYGSPPVVEENQKLKEEKPVQEVKSLPSSKKKDQTIMARLHVAHDGRVFDPKTEKELSRADLVAMHKLYSKQITKKSKIYTLILDKLIKALPPGELKYVALPMAEAKGKWVRDEKPHVDKPTLGVVGSARKHILRNLHKPEFKHLNVPGGPTSEMLEPEVNKLANKVMSTKHAGISFSHSEDPSKKAVFRKLGTLSTGKPLYVGHNYEQVKKKVLTPYDAPTAEPKYQYTTHQHAGGLTGDQHHLLAEVHKDYTPEEHAEAATMLFNHGLSKVRSFTPDEVKNKIIGTDSPDKKTIQRRTVALRGENIKEAKNILSHIQAHGLEAAHKHADPKLDEQGNPTRTPDLFTTAPGATPESVEARKQYWSKDDLREHVLQPFMSVESTKSEEETPLSGVHGNVKNIFNAARGLKREIAASVESPLTRESLKTPEETRTPTQKVASYLTSRPKGYEKTKGEVVSESPIIPYHSGEIATAEAIGPTIRHGKHLAHHDERVSELQRKLKMAQASVKVTPTEEGPPSKSPEHIRGLEGKLSEAQSTRDEMGKWGYLHSKRYNDSVSGITNFLGKLSGAKAFRDPSHEEKASKLVNRISKHWSDFENPTSDLGEHHEKVRKQLADLHRVYGMASPENVKREHQQTAKHLRGLIQKHGSSITPEFEVAPQVPSVDPGMARTDIENVQAAHRTRLESHAKHLGKVLTSGSKFTPQTSGTSLEDIGGEIAEGYRKIDVGRGTQAAEAASGRGKLARRLEEQEARSAEEKISAPEVEEHMPVSYGEITSEEFEDLTGEKATPETREFEESKQQEAAKKEEISELAAEHHPGKDDEPIDVSKEQAEGMLQRESLKPTDQVTSDWTRRMASMGGSGTPGKLSPMEAHADIAMAHEKAHRDTMKEMEGSRLPAEQHQHVYVKTYGKHLGKHIRGIVQQQKLQYSTKKSLTWLLDMTDEFRGKLVKSHIDFVNHFNKGYKEFTKSIIKDNLKKALGVSGAGYEGAPTAMTGGNVLQAESLDKKPKVTTFPDGVTTRHCDVCDSDAPHFGKICFKCAINKDWDPKDVELLEKEKKATILRAYLTSSLKKGFTNTDQLLAIFEEKIYPKLVKGAYDISPAGHTNSGRPFYMTSDDETFGARHEGFTAEDHADAFNFYNRKLGEHMPSSGSEPDAISTHYANNAQRHLDRFNSFFDSKDKNEAAEVAAKPKRDKE